MIKNNKTILQRIFLCASLFLLLGAGAVPPLTQSRIDQLVDNCTVNKNQLNFCIEKFFYPVEGKNINEIAQYLTAGVVREVGQAATLFQLMDTKIFTQDSSCWLENPTALIFHHVSLPEPVNYTSLSQDDRLAWDKLYQTLERHEYNHVSISEGQYRLLYGELSQFKANGRLCDNVSTVINQKINAAYNRANTLNKQYDRETNHGIKEGSVLEVRR